MKKLKFEVTVEVVNRFDEFDVYKEVRDAIFNLCFHSAEVLPVKTKKKIWKKK